MTFSVGAGPAEGAAGDPGHRKAEALRADDAALHHRLLSIRDAAGLPEEISVLRVFDVIAWMDGKNRGRGTGSDLGR